LSPSSGVATSAAVTAATTELPAVTVGRMTVAWTAADGLLLSFDNVPVVRGSQIRIIGDGRTLLDAASGNAKVSGWEDSADGGKKASVTLSGEEATVVLALAVLPSGDVTVAANVQRADGARVPATLFYTAGLLAGSVAQGAWLEAHVGTGRPMRRQV